MDDEALVAQALDGQPRAFDALVDRYHEGCFRFAWRMLGNAHDAEDVVQETFVRAYRHLGRFDPHRSFHAWLYRILVNRVRTRAGRDRRWAHRVRSDSAAIERAPSPDRNGSWELRDRLQKALARLDPGVREAVVLKLGEGLAYAEISDRTGVSIPALKMRVLRGREALRHDLEEDPT
jgi:RNA polymerase sigma-70 factor, ECF subfamily